MLTSISVPPNPSLITSPSLVAWNMAYKDHKVSALLHSSRRHTVTHNPAPQLRNTLNRNTNPKVSISQFTLRLYWMLCDVHQNAFSNNYVHFWAYSRCHCHDEVCMTSAYSQIIHQKSPEQHIQGTCPGLPQPYVTQHKAPVSHSKPINTDKIGITLQDFEFNLLKGPSGKRNELSRGKHTVRY